MTQQQRDFFFLAGLFLGATVGAAVASILAHPSGSEATAPAERGIELTGRADEAVQRAQQIAGAAVAKVQGALPATLRQPDAAAGS